MYLIGAFIAAGKICNIFGISDVTWHSGYGSLLKI